MALVRSQHSRAVAAAGDYADNDVVSNSASNNAGTPWTFRNMAPNGSGRPAEIVRALLTCDEDSVVASFRLHLFNASPSLATEQDDNAAFALDNDDRAKYLGFIDFPAMGDMGEASISQVSPAFHYDCGDGGSILYGILQITDAEANETAGMTVAITLWAR